MSILSEYEDIKKQIGEDKWNAIDKYIDTKRPDLRLDEIVYEPENWIEFEKWYYNWVFEDGTKGHICAVNA